jgi:alpha-methylacyl-CoA racemase
LPVTSGPLTGLRVIEIAGLGPGPHAAMLLADLGAEVVRISRPPAPDVDPEEFSLNELMRRGKRTVFLDLKSPADLQTALELIDRSDVLIEAMRPGVTTRIGIGPDACLARNPRLIYAQMTGWGQTGPLALRAGHDINYLSLTGMLHAIGHADGRPVPPLNLVADFGGGSMLLLIGVLSALWERERSGQGQVVDATMLDGVGALSHMMWEMTRHGEWTAARGTNLLDSGAPFYDTYACADGGYVAVGPLEAPFYSQLVTGLGLVESELPPQNDRAGWPELRSQFTAAFASRTRDEWTEVFGDTDACVSPVLDMDEATRHPHLVDRRAHLPVGDAMEPAPAPRFSRTSPADPAEHEVIDVQDALKAWS